MLSTALQKFLEMLQGGAGATSYIQPNIKHPKPVMQDRLAMTKSRGEAPEALTCIEWDGRVARLSHHEHRKIASSILHQLPKQSAL